jgi:hypothetical protein
VRADVTLFNPQTFCFVVKTRSDSIKCLVEGLGQQKSVALRQNSFILSDEEDSCFVRGNEMTRRPSPPMTCRAELKKRRYK